MYRTFFLTIAAILLSSAWSEAGVTIKPVDGGIEIQCGTLGGFTIEPPKLMGANQKDVATLVEKKHDGATATYKYTGGVLVEAKVEAGSVTYKVTGAGSNAKYFRTMAIFNYTAFQGGTYRAGDGAETPFPAEKPAKPHLFQGNVKLLSIKGADGTALSVLSPRDHTFIQLTDNREWGWKAYGFMTLTPVEPGNAVFKFTATSDDAAPRTKLVDAFGQPTKVEFPDKVKSLEELKADVEAEKAYYDSLTPPAFDRLGGMPGGEKLGLKKTGFFHVEKKGDKWMLVNPEGNLFYALGVCVYMPVDDYTYIQGREQIYESLPSPEGEFATAFRPKEPSALSFHLVNQIRKYGRPYEVAEYQTRMLTRLRKWGFNTVGPFSQPSSAVQEQGFPYVLSLPYGAWPGIPEIPGVDRAWDPFEPANIKRLEESFTKGLPARANDPLLIGYYLNNEPIYEDLPRVIPRLPASKNPCKARLVQLLREKYAGKIEDFNAAWKMQAKGFDDLLEPGIPVATPAAADDMQAYMDLFFETYYKLIHDNFRKHDTNHMLIGNRFQSGTINNERMVRIAAKYLDVISFNYYTYGIDTDFLKRIYAWSGKPMMLTEWFYDSPKESGLPGGGKDVNSQDERGLAYRNYVEQSAALDFVVGQTWFTLVDQALTGRWFSKYNGENANSGLIAVTDRPWKSMLKHAMETNYSIYDVTLGKRPAFAWDDPRFKMSEAASKRLNIPRAIGPIAMDGTAKGFPGTPAEPVSGKRLVLGTNADGFEASYKVCYDNDNLYVLVDVVDPTPLQNTNEPDHLWSGDGIELFTGHEKLEQPGQPLFSDRQILIGADKEARTYVARLTEQPKIRSVVVPRVDGKGYVLQAAIPHAVLGFKPTEGAEMRFDLAIDDSADGKRRDRQLMWNGTARNSGDRSGWGHAIFGK